MSEEVSRKEWEAWVHRRAEAHKLCRDAMDRLFPKDRYEIKKVMPIHMDSDFDCLVDFVDKELSPDFSCEPYCEEMEEEEDAIEECIEACEDSLNSAKIGSVRFDPRTLMIKEATIPRSCEGLWWPEDMDKREFEKEKEKIKKHFRRFGCLVDPGSFDCIHPHELAHIGVEVEEEPAICYVHPEHLDSKCKLDNLLKALD